MANDTPMYDIMHVYNGTTMYLYVLIQVCTTSGEVIMAVTLVALPHDQDISSDTNFRKPFHSHGIVMFEKSKGRQDSKVDTLNPMHPGSISK